MWCMVIPDKEFISFFSCFSVFLKKNKLRKYFQNNNFGFPNSIFHNLFHGKFGYCCCHCQFCDALQCNSKTAEWKSLCNVTQDSGKSCCFAVVWSFAVKFIILGWHGKGLVAQYAEWAASVRRSLGLSHVGHSWSQPALKGPKTGQNWAHDPRRWPLCDKIIKKG